MNRFYVCLAEGLAVLAFASCSMPSVSTSKAGMPTGAPDAVDRATTASTASANKDFTALQHVVANTKAAVEAGNYEQAKTAFDHFEASWRTVEDGVKTQSAATYDAIETATDDVNQGIKDKHQAQILTALQKLTKYLASAAKV